MSIEGMRDYCQRNEKTLTTEGTARHMTGSATYCIEIVVVVAAALVFLG
jgi:hypothetical protein